MYVFVFSTALVILISDFIEGENVLDLGSGGGVDVLLAAAKVGRGGQAIGLDMSAVCTLLLLTIIGLLHSTPS